MKRFLSALIYSLIFSTHADAAPTKKELNRLEAQMISIKKQLSQDEASRDQRYQSLAHTEKKISHDLHALHQLTTQEKEKKSAINGLKKQIETLNQALKNQEKILAKHIRARHQLGAIHPWQWLLHQDNPQRLSRLFVFYQYLFQADQTLIKQMRETTTELSKQQDTLTTAQDKLKKLQASLRLRQKRLAQLKKEQQALIHQLNKKIKTKHEQLKTYHQDKTRLQTLLNKLKIRSKKIPHPSTLNFEGKRLATPLDKAYKKTKPLNHGLVFLAQEGTPVVSVLPGKVIFSDWLKGYGLLLIIDHGHDIMSLYAHNASLFKPLGASVKQGEQIATVGHTGGLRENGLYFEVRRSGRAVPPREWMS
jgi:septal ring factor EnvC (AmiA/AmiB activator)